MKTSVTAIPLILITLVKNARYSSLPLSTVSTVRYDDQECEFPPKIEEDLTSVRRKRLTTEDGLVCLEDYPYTVSIRLDGKHWCGGAIIGSKWILSAAQCFDYIDEAEITVRMGSVFRNFGGKIVPVDSIRRHPNYQLNRYYPEHNLAMLKLKMPIVPGPRIQTVQLPPPNADVPSFTGEIVVTGYGAVTTGQLHENDHQELRRMITALISKSECRSKYGNDYHIQMDHMCLQSVVPGIALCSGDTGNPAVHFSGFNRMGTLYGIALFSGSEECAYKSKPGIYAQVSFSRAWIDEELSSADSASNSSSIDKRAVPEDYINDTQDSELLLIDEDPATNETDVLEESDTYNET